MKLYPVYLVVAAVTVLSPGPGVVMTLTNSLHCGLKGAFGGILGISFGALLIAAVSATSLGVVLASSATVFAIAKYLGAAYLVYLGFRAWLAPALQIQVEPSSTFGFKRNFLKGMTLQFTNPKAIFFFLSVLPQFIDRELNFAVQLSLMGLTYSLLIIVIHWMYALGAQRSRLWLASETGGFFINRLSGTIFVAFGVLLAVSKT
jgi:homoserine/homoserine lactone efflux protein